MLYFFVIEFWLCKGQYNLHLIHLSWQKKQHIITWQLHSLCHIPHRYHSKNIHATRNEEIKIRENLLISYIQFSHLEKLLNKVYFLFYIHHCHLSLSLSHPLLFLFLTFTLSLSIFFWENWYWKYIFQIIHVFKICGRKFNIYSSCCLFEFTVLCICHIKVTTLTFGC